MQNDKNQQSDQSTAPITKKLDLEKIYFQPKSEGQIQADKLNDNLRHQARKPKLLTTKLSIFGGLLLAGVLLLLQNIDNLWSSGSLGAVSLTFLAAILLLVLIIMTVNFLNDALWQNDRAEGPFWTFYLIGISLLLALWANNFFLGENLKYRLVLTIFFHTFAAILTVRFFARSISK